LPEPLGPTRAVTWPGGATRSMSATASTWPNRRRTPRAEIPAVGCMGLILPERRPSCASANRTSPGRPSLLL